MDVMDKGRTLTKKMMLYYGLMKHPLLILYILLASI